MLVKTVQLVNGFGAMRGKNRRVLDILVLTSLVASCRPEVDVLHHQRSSHLVVNNYTTNDLSSTELKAFLSDKLAEFSLDISQQVGTFDDCS